jgi:uroporphyrin-III C-methyltransferase
MSNLSHLHLPRFAHGSVWLCGAGPGDPGLLTVLTLHALDHADIVVHDALVGRDILALANPRARVIAAGKRGGGRSVSQDAINDMLVRHASEGRRVLRLKGGDPFVFGRGAEEAATLAQVGIPFRVVPGVSAGIGGLAYAGIPVTHRDANSLVAFVTGQGRDGALPDLDWDALARACPVIVLFMGTRTLPEIAVKLLAAGRAASTPVAIVSNATTGDQTVIETTLGAATLDLRRKQAKTPAIIAIGEVVRMRALIDWYAPQISNAAGAIALGA